MKNRMRSREADIPIPSDSTTSTPRDGIPATVRGKPMVWSRPQVTTAPDTGLKLDPMQHDAGTAPFLATGSAGNPLTRSGQLGDQASGPSGSNPMSQFLARPPKPKPVR